MTSSGIDAHQAQVPSRPSKVPAGTAGVSGCPVHQAPEQGRGPRGVGSGSNGPARSRIKGSTSEERCPRSFREVTRCEQPAFATGGASRASARSVATAPAGEKNRCLVGRVLVIRRVLWLGSPSAMEGGKFPGKWGEARSRASMNLGSTHHICKRSLFFPGDHRTLPSAGVQRRERDLPGSPSSGSRAASVTRLKNTSWLTWWISSAIWVSL